MATDAQSIENPSWLRAIVIGRRPHFTAVRVVILIVTVTVLRLFVILPIQMSGASMLPTYPTKGVNFVNRLAYRWHEPQLGDVVAVRLAGEHIMYMKRIVGLPGETIEFIGGQLFVDGKLRAEPYLKFPSSWDVPAKKLSADQYYVVGDNRTMRPEDHTFGRAERERIIGKVML